MRIDLTLCGIEVRPLATFHSRSRDGEAIHFANVRDLKTIAACFNTMTVVAVIQAITDFEAQVYAA